jgi:two-component system chemotaxis response regulator CheB
LKFAIVVIGGSAGALSAIQQIAADVAPDIPAAIFVATHIPADSVSALPHIISRCGPLFAAHAIDGAPIAPGRIIVAPPNFHLVVERDVMRVVDWAKENGQRPAIDVLFRSAAASYGDLVCGVLLSGALDDGVAGLQSIRTAGGVTIVQDPEDALFSDMPRNAIAADAAQITAPTEALGASITQSVYRIVERARGEPAPEAAYDERKNGAPSRYTCPDCGGTLWEMEEEGTFRFRCRTGHAYNVNSVMSAQHDALENSLWTALRVVEERIDLLKRMEERARRRKDRHSADRFAHQAHELEADHGRLRAALESALTQRRTSA